MAAALAWAVSGPLVAQEPAAPPVGEVVDLAPVVVSGVQPGPGLWQVTAPNGHRLWILGTVTPLPKKIDWRADEVKAVIASADAVLSSPGWTVDADVGFFGRLTLIRPAMKAAHDPEGRRLEQILPADVYARWLRLKQPYLGRDRGVEKDRPLVAATRLYAAALDEVGLEQRSPVTKVLEKAYKARGLKPVETRVVIKVEDPRKALKEMQANALDDVQCLERTMDRVEHELPLLVERANAWSVGDVEALQRFSTTGPYDACVGAITRSEFGRRRGLADLDARAAQAWMRAAQKGLAEHDVLFATVPVYLLVSPDGYLERLKQAGYSVQAP
ncbi:TraB/GumN family protein [Stenotrophomonas sp.]|uniref:TraB/GumN family protein n=1 Tax=Stenotrophomonas sp. TaxID=69392 RepID=UPI0028B09E27|nr:TraB/GumN family protein [Stenotrophomonas sp.]